MGVRIYHNPRCSKSRQTLQLLRDKGIEPEIVEYLNDPPSATELKRILGLLGKQPREIMRRQETEYKAAGLDKPDLGDDALIAGMVANPKVIERPIVVAGKKAALGRPPEAVLDIL